MQVADQKGNVRGVLGQVELVESFDGYDILVVKDNKNQIHAIDSRSDNLRFYASSTPDETQLEFLNDFSERLFSYIDLERLFQHVQPHRNSVRSSSEFNRLNEIFDNIVNDQELADAKAIYKKLATIVTPAFGASFSMEYITRAEDFRNRC